MDRHVTEAIHNCNYHIQALQHIQPLLTLDHAKTIGRIVSLQLDYANALLHGMSAGNLDRLQVTQNSLARTVLQAPYSASATELHRQLHWLPIRQWIMYKTYKTRRDPLAHQLTHLNSSMTTVQMHITIVKCTEDDALLLTKVFSVSPQSVPRMTLSLLTKAFSIT